MSNAIKSDQNEDVKQIRQILLNAPLGYNPSNPEQKEETLTQFKEQPSILSSVLKVPELVGAV